ncbi:MAG: hypothetical protein PHE78_07860 [Candidatus Gastranaerophilales bacterium]|nr:hypothetical protein [Candidatus Gastranaerophilales bacterium]
MKITPLGGKKPVDVIKFTVKNADSDIFFDTTFERFNQGLIKKQKTATMILENPGYDEYEENFEKLRFGNWAAQNLKMTKGYDVAVPKGTKESGSFDLYFFMTKEADKKLTKNFDSFKGFVNRMVDIVKSNYTTKKFSRSVGGAKYDIHYVDAYNFLADHELNRLQQNRFQKMLSTMNVKTVKYKPPSSGLDKTA